MNNKSKLQIITSLLAICASVVAACVCVLLISGEYHSAHFEMDTYKRELQGWEACRQTNPAYFKANEQAVNSCLKSIDQAQDNFWVKLSNAHFIGLLGLAGLVSAAIGYLATWVVVRIIGMSILKFYNFIALFFKYCAHRPAQNKKKLHSFATKP